MTLTSLTEIKSPVFGPNALVKSIMDEGLLKEDYITAIILDKNKNIVGDVRSLDEFRNNYLEGKYPDNKFILFASNYNGNLVFSEQIVEFLFTQMFEYLKEKDAQFLDLLYIKDKEMFTSFLCDDDACCPRALPGVDL